jgi:hypothetical protein
MLRREAWRCASRADVTQADRLTRDGGKRTGGTQKLPAALAIRTVDIAHSAILIQWLAFDDGQELKRPRPPRENYFKSG